MIQVPAVQNFLSCANCRITLLALPNLLEGIGVIAPLCGDADTCAIVVKSFGTRFFSHPQFGLVWLARVFGWMDNVPISFNEISKTNKFFFSFFRPHLHISTATVPKNSCGTHDTSSRSTAFSVLRKLQNNTCGIAQSHRRYRGLSTPGRRRRYLCDNRMKSFGIRFFSHPLCQDHDPCGDADPREDPDSSGNYLVPLYTYLHTYPNITHLGRYQACVVCVANRY